MGQPLRHIISVFLIWSAAFSSSAAEEVDPALFGALPSISLVEISPNGETVALLQNSGGEATVVFVELNDPGATPKGVPVGAVKARSMEWVDNNYLLLLASDAKGTSLLSGMETKEFFRWISISKDERKLRILFRQDQGFYVTSAGSIVATTPETTEDLVMARWTPDARVPSRATGRLGRDIGDGYSLFHVNARTARESITYRGNAETWDWIVDAEGEAILRIDFDEKTNERKIYRRREGNKTFEHIATIKGEYGGPKGITFFGIGGNSREILAQTYGGENTSGLVGFDIDTGEISRTVFRDEKYDVTDVYYDPTKATVTAVYYTDDFPRAFHLNPDDQQLQESLARALPGAIPYIGSKSQNGDKLIIWAAYPDRPTDIYLFDKPSRNLALFSSTRPQLADRPYGQKTKFSYITPDGLDIDGYLTTPAGANSNNLPLIVLPHWGAESRDDQSFDWWAFFYAARGYAVYQPNFRGSYGYGLSFREAGYGEWGRKMQDDITNGVQKLIQDGVVDPNRICIVGGSYGGYAALAGATLTPSLYACAVSVNGVSDLPTMIRDRGHAVDFLTEYWETRIGSRFRDSDELAAVSPARRAASAGAPIMLIHGKDDTVVPFYQSEIMRNALADANKPYEFVELEGEDHWLSIEETRTEMLRKSIEFIDKHIGNNE